MKKGQKKRPGLTRKERQAEARLYRREQLTPEAIVAARQRMDRMLSQALGNLRRTRSYP